MGFMQSEEAFSERSKVAINITIATVSQTKSNVMFKHLCSR